MVLGVETLGACRFHPPSSKSITLDTASDPLVRQQDRMGAPQPIYRRRCAPALVAGATRITNQETIGSRRRARSAGNAAALDRVPAYAAVARHRHAGTATGQCVAVPTLR